MRRVLLSEGKTVEAETILTREMFVSAPDQTLIVALRASEKGALGFTASLNAQLRGAVRAIGNGICLDAQCPSHAKPEYVHDPNPFEWLDVPEKTGVRFCACRRTD